MPPIKKISKEDIINTSLKIIKTDTIDNLNARRLAKELNTSVQPIFYNFKNMEELKMCLIDKIYNLYKEYMNNAVNEDCPYKGMGLAYIKFAKEYPNYFKLLFMSKTSMSPDSFIANDDIGNNVIRVGMQFSNLSYDEQKKFHLKVWIFTHGLATLVATQTVYFTNRQIEQLLTDTVNKLLMGVRKEKE